MNITGSFVVDAVSGSFVLGSPLGALYLITNTGEISSSVATSGTSNTRKIGFDASKNWTGESNDYNKKTILKILCFL